MIKTSAGILDNLIGSDTQVPWLCDIASLMVHCRAYELACVRSNVTLKLQDSASAFFDSADERLRIITGCQWTIGIDALYIGAFGRGKALDALRSDWLNWRSRTDLRLSIDTPQSFRRVSVNDIVPSLVRNYVMAVGVASFRRVEAYIRGYLCVNEQMGDTVVSPEMDDLGAQFKRESGLLWSRTNDLFDLILLDCRFDEERALQRLDEVFKRSDLFSRR